MDKRTKDVLKYDVSPADIDALEVGILALMSYICGPDHAILSTKNIVKLFSPGFIIAMKSGSISGFSTWFSEVVHFCKSEENARQ